MSPRILHWPRSGLLWEQFSARQPGSQCAGNLLFHILAESLETEATMLQASQVQDAQVTVPLFSVPTGTRTLRRLIYMWAW